MTPDPADVAAPWTVVGSVGGGGFAVLDAAGTLSSAAGPRAEPWSLDWWIGADDGWHVPTRGSVRHRLASPGVIETRCKVPSGDAVQRVYAVGGQDDLVVVEIENDSPLPFGVAFGLHGTPLLSFPREPFPLDAPPAPCSAAVHLPVAHRTTLRMAVSLAVGRRRTTAPRSVDVARLPSVSDVERGWRAQIDAGMRVDVPDGVFMHAVDAGRAHLLTFDDGVQPVPAPVTGVAGPSDAALMLSALERWGYESHAAELRPSVASRHRKRVPSYAPDPVAVDAMIREASPTIAWARGAEAHHGARTAEFLLLARELLVSESAEEVQVLPELPESWRGGAVEVHQAPLRGDGHVSFAIRWHDDRPALMWDLHGRPRRITAPALDPSWASTELRGEALLSPARV